MTTTAVPKNYGETVNRREEILQAISNATGVDITGSGTTSLSGPPDGFSLTIRTGIPGMDNMEKARKIEEIVTHFNQTNGKGLHYWSEALEYERPQASSAMFTIKPNRIDNFIEFCERYAAAKAANDSRTSQANRTGNELGAAQTTR
jgi:hypothetical protein